MDCGPNGEFDRSRLQCDCAVGFTGERCAEVAVGNDGDAAATGDDSSNGGSTSITSAQGAAAVGLLLVILATGACCVLYLTRRNSKQDDNAPDDDLGGMTDFIISDSTTHGATSAFIGHGTELDEVGLFDDTQTIRSAAASGAFTSTVDIIDAVDAVSSSSSSSSSNEF